MSRVLTPEEMDELKRIIAARNQATDMQHGTPYEQQAQTYRGQADQLEQEAAKPYPQPRGVRERIVSAIRAGMENFGRYAAPGGYYGQQARREEQYATEQQGRLARAKELRSQAQQQQELGQSAVRGAQSARLQEEQNDLTRGLRDIQQQTEDRLQKAANAPRVDISSPGSVRTVTDSGTGKITDQQTLGERPEPQRTQGYRDRTDERGHTIRDYFDQNDPSTVTSSADLGPRNTGSRAAPQRLTNERGQVIGWMQEGKLITPEELGITSPVFSGPMAMDRQTREGAAASGLGAIRTFREEMKKNPNLLAQLAIPGSPGARIAQAARNEMADVLTRVRTGAALNEDEQRFYSGQAPGLLDTLFDDPAAVDYKLRLFEYNYMNLAPPHVREAYLSGKPLPNITGQGQPPANTGQQPANTGGMQIKPGGALDNLLNRRK